MTFNWPDVDVVSCGIVPAELPVPTQVISQTIDWVDVIGDVVTWWYW